MCNLWDAIASLPNYSWQSPSWLAWNDTAMILNVFRTSTSEHWMPKIIPNNCTFPKHLQFVCWKNIIRKLIKTIYFIWPPKFHSSNFVLRCSTLSGHQISDFLKNEFYKTFEQHSSISQLFIAGLGCHSMISRPMQATTRMKKSLPNHTHMEQKYPNYCERYLTDCECLCCLPFLVSN